MTNELRADGPTPPTPLRESNDAPPRGFAAHTFHIASWVFGLALVLAYARGSNQSGQLVVMVFGCYLVTSAIGLYAPFAVQAALSVLLCVLPVFTAMVIWARGPELGEIPPNDVLLVAAMATTLVVGVPAWLAMLATRLMNLFHAPRGKRRRFVVQFLLLLLCWGLAIALVYARRPAS